MIELQGGDSSVLTTEGMKKLAEVKRHVIVEADKDGYVTDMNAEGIGTAAQMLGAGRAKKEDAIDPAVGLIMKVRCGARVKKGDPLCEMYVNDERYLDDAMKLFRDSIHIRDVYEEPEPMVYGVVM